MKLDTTVQFDDRPAAINASRPGVGTTDELPSLATDVPQVRQADGGQQPSGVTATVACPHCGAAQSGPTSWCTQCGYHPALGRCIELCGMWEESAESPVNLWNVIPRWVWITAAGAGAVILMSVGARFGLASHDGPRAWWAVVQLTLGALMAFSAHILAFVYASMKSAQFGPFDVVLKPIEIWKPVFGNMPQQAWRLWGFVWGKTAALCALVVVGGLSYDALFEDWGVRKRANFNLTHAIIDQARNQQHDSDKTMEQAINDFTGTAGTGGLKPQNQPAAAPKKPLLLTECLVIGYRTSRGADRQLSALLLAAINRGTLRFAGIVSAAEIPEEERSELVARLPALHRERPFVRCRRSAHWLQPVLMCEVESEGWNRGGTLKKPKFRRMLADLPVR